MGSSPTKAGLKLPRASCDHFVFTNVSFLCVHRHFS